MTDHLDIVTVGPNNKGGIVILVIERAKARRPVVFGACFDGHFKERIHLITSVGFECQV